LELNLSSVCVQVDELWREACGKQAITLPICSPSKQSSSAARPCSDAFLMSLELPSSTPMEAVKISPAHTSAPPLTNSTTSDVAFTQPAEVQARHVYAQQPHSTQHAQRSSLESRRFLLMATDCGNLRESSGGVGMYRCNTWEYGNPGPLLTRHSLTAVHSSRYGSRNDARSGSPLATCTIAADCGPSEPTQRQGLGGYGITAQVKSQPMMCHCCSSVFRIV
jgi:hypothetical protein